MLTVLSVLRSGGSFSAKDVACLHHGVEANLSERHRFSCLTDMPGEVATECPKAEILPLQHDWPGWWSKCEGYRILGPVLYLDLDTVVVGDIGKLAEAVENLEPGRLLLIHDFYKAALQTGIMGWSGSVANAYMEFATNWAPKAEFVRHSRGVSMQANGKHFLGDGDWLRWYLQENHAPEPETAQNVLGDGLKSYKVDGLNGSRIPDGTRVIAFHGHPRPGDLKPAPAWLRSAWGQK